MAEIIVDLNKIETEDELLVRLYPAKGEKGEQGEKGANGAKGDKGETGASGGSAVVVDTVADMIDTTQAYLYVGNETGYTKGDWYYYDGTEWVSGGQYGADGGINTNARNILKYILERVAYTEQGMQTYVDALYQALAQGGGGGGTTTYMIMNALTNVTNSNDATGADEGDSYTATLTADSGYDIDTVTVTMGGVDVTSTVYSNGTITISSVNGDVVITATAIVAQYELIQSAQGIGSNANLYRDAGVTNFDSLKTSGAIYYYLPDPVTNNTTYEVSIIISTALNNHQYKAVYAYSGDLLSGAGTATPTMYNVVTLAQNGIVNAQGNPLTEPYTFTKQVTVSANTQLAIVFYRDHSSVITSITATRVG